MCGCGQRAGQAASSRAQAASQEHPRISAVNNAMWTKPQGSHMAQQSNKQTWSNNNNRQCACLHVLCGVVGAVAQQALLLVED